MTHLLLILLSLALYTASTWIIRNHGRRTVIRYSFSLCGLCLVFLTGFFLISDSFTTSGIDESVVYHLKYGLAGAGFREYTGALIATGAFFLLSGMTFITSLWIIKTPRESRTPSRTWTAQLMLGAAFLVHPGVQDVYHLNAPIFIHPPGPTRFAVFHRMPKLVNHSAQPKNLVYIYAESLERTYFDDDLFPGLITGLKELEHHALSFTGVDQVGGTHWTIAGMVASQCGIPLVTASGGNSMSGIDRFLPGATCIGDVLHSRGYSLTFMGGADLNFAGKGKFLASHGFSEMLGKQELQETLVDQHYVSAWGLYDDILLDQVYRRFETLAQADAPFALFALTLDTHHPKGHISRRCDDMLYQEGDNAILNAVHCSDFLITEFVRKVLHSPHAHNTMIVIGSDHLAMGNTATELLERGDRKNLLMVLDPSRERAGFVDKQGTTLDVAATLLSLLGYEAPAFGLGRNLLAHAPTLAEQEPNLKQTLESLSPDLNQFWEYPIIRDGIRIDARTFHIQIEDRTLRFPALLQVDGNGKIRNVFFEYQLFDYSEKLASHFVKMDYDDAVVWIDACRNFQRLDISQGEAKFCVFLGKIGDEHPFVSSIEDELFIPMTQISEALSRIAVPTIAVKRINSLDSANLSQLATARNSLHHIDERGLKEAAVSRGVFAY